MESLCDLLFEVSNEVRLTILQMLRGGATTVTSLAKELDISNQECSRHVSRLQDSGLAEKDPDGMYRLTEFGKLFLKQIEGPMFTSENREYFTSHTVDRVPEAFIARIGELKGSLYVDDVMAVFQNIQEACHESEEYIWMVTDHHLNLVHPHLQAAVDRGIEFRMIEPEVVEHAPHVEVLPRVRPGEVRGLEGVDVFIVISEKEAAALAFPETEGDYDYLGFTSRDEGTLKWCKELFLYYWDKARPKLE